MLIKTEDQFIKSETPESQGLNDNLLNQIIENIQEWQIKNIVIVRNGYLVWEWHEDKYDKANYIFSCTKSVLGILIGILSDKGFINIEQPIVDFFPCLNEKKFDDRMKYIKIKHLLNMTSGIDWPSFDKLSNKMKGSGDAVEFVLNRPIADIPGEVFNYNSGGSHLLSAILTKITGESAFVFADQHLFKPLAFTSPSWKNNNNISLGGTGLHISTIDMAKLGYLFLKNGNWFGKVVVSNKWVDESTRIQSSGYVDYNPRIFGYYGYQWWISPKYHNQKIDYYYALGYGGQYIFVVPELELVVAVRKALNGRINSFIPKKVLYEYILNAVKS